MKQLLLTFNIQHGFNYLKKDGIDLIPIADFIKKINPDVVLLNEVRGKGVSSSYTDQTGFLASLLSWNSYFSKAFDVPNEGPYGNALLSPHSFKAKTFAVPEPETKDRCFEPRAVLKAEFENYTVFGTHFGLSEEEQKNAVFLVSSLAKAEKCPYAFMGDLNLTPESPILSPLYDIMTDTAPHLSEPSEKTFPSDSPEMKIDYIFVSPNTKILRSEILPDIISDHRAYLSEVEF